jgi:hypothetical protein
LGCCAVPLKCLLCGLAFFCFPWHSAWVFSRYGYKKVCFERSDWAVKNVSMLTRVVCRVFCIRFFFFLSSIVRTYWKYILVYSKQKKYDSYESTAHMYLK